MKTGSAEALTTEVVEAMTTNETFFSATRFRSIICGKRFCRRCYRRAPTVDLADLVRGIFERAGALLDRDGSEGIRRSAGRVADRDRRDRPVARGARKVEVRIFSQFEVQRGLPIQLLVKHFTQIGELWQLRADIRGMVQYRPLNLLQDFAHLGTFDVIFCRNVLIYFDQETKTGVFERLAKDRSSRTA